MTSIIISILLNVLLGNPTDTTTEQNKNTNNTTTTTTAEKQDETMSVMGGSGTWTTIEK